MAIYKDDIVVVHVPYNMAPSLSQFLRRDINKAFAEVMGEKVNRGVGYGLYNNTLCASPLWTQGLHRQDEGTIGLTEGLLLT